MLTGGLRNDSASWPLAGVGAMRSHRRGSVRSLGVVGQSHESAENIIAELRKTRNIAACI